MIRATEEYGQFKDGEIQLNQTKRSCFKFLSTIKEESGCMFIVNEKDPTSKSVL